jgi:DNA-binding MarR family transcriptional regulator
MSILKDIGVAQGGRSREEIVYGVGCAYNLLTREFSLALQPYNIGLSKFNILMIVKHIGREAGISQEDIGKKLIVTAANMSRLIDKLEKEGLLTRALKEGNRRVKLVRVTKKGSELLDKVWPVFYKRLSELTQSLSESECRSLGGLINTWVAALGKK